MPFVSLGLVPSLALPLARRGYASPTPVQAAAIPVMLEGRDVFARAQTGTGKTAAFGLPMIQRLFSGPAAGPAASRQPRGLVLVPTRELALQVHESLVAYGQPMRLRVAAIFGGVSIGPQISALSRGVDIVVATPGRLIDHLGQRTIDLSRVEILVLDEADRMLDMGFLPPLRRILAVLPTKRQTLLCSATLAPEVQELAASFTRDPVQVDVTPKNTVAVTVSHFIHYVTQDNKRALLTHILRQPDSGQTLVFCRTKHGSNRVGRQLELAGVKVGVIHGNKSQNARVRALSDFKSGRVEVLVATDVAARGLDIAQLPLVINYDLPLVAADYVHRIGRTGRAGAPGRAISLVAGDEVPLLRDIQKLLSAPLEKLSLPGFETPAFNIPSAESAGRGGRPQGYGRGRSSRPPREHSRGEASGSQGQASAENGRGHGPSRRPSHSGQPHAPGGASRRPPQGGSHRPGQANQHRPAQAVSRRHEHAAPKA
jgi:ATP-dependent RNA helicase RhlE